MQSLRGVFETVLIVIIIALIVSYFFRAEPEPEVVIEERIEYKTIVDTHFVEVPGEVVTDTVFVDSGAEVTQEKAVAKQTFEKEDKYKANLKVEYFFNDEVFRIYFDIEIQEKTVYVDRIEKRTLTKPFFQPVVGLSISNMSDGYAVGLNAGLRLADRLNLLFGVDTEKNLNLYLNYTL